MRYQESIDTSIKQKVSKVLKEMYRYQYRIVRILSIFISINKKKRSYSQICIISLY